MKEPMPPKNLGMSGEAVEKATTAGTWVRYWPLRDLTCRPHEGCVRGSANLPGVGWVLWVAGKPGYVLATHCEAIPPVSEKDVQK